MERLSIQKVDRAALEKLILANLGLVTSLAKKYVFFGVPIDDLVSEGTVALIKAAQRFARKYILQSAQANLQIIKAKLGNKAAIVGIGLLALDHLKK